MRRLVRILLCLAVFHTDTVQRVTILVYKYMLRCSHRMREMLQQASRRLSAIAGLFVSLLMHEASITSRGACVLTS